MYATGVMTMSTQHNLLQSEVVSFFTPVTTNVDSSNGTSVAPKFDIFEPTAPKSKTITLTCDKVENSSATLQTDDPDPHTDVSRVYRLERLDSSINPDVTAKLDRIAQKLGFQVSTKSGTANHNTNSDCEDLQLDDADLVGPDVSGEAAAAKPPNPPQSQNPTASGPKRSLFSSLKKRLSFRPKMSASTTRENSGDRQNSRSRATSADSRPMRIRQWLSKRFWRPKTPEHKEPEPSEVSMASAGAMLEGNFAFSSIDQINTSGSQLNSKGLPSKISDNLPVSQSAHSGPMREFVSLEELSPCAAIHNGRSKAEVVAGKIHSNAPATAGPYSSNSQYKALTLPFSQNGDTVCPRLPATVSFSQSSLLCDHSIRSTGVDSQDHLNGGSFLSREACGSEGTALHRRHGDSVRATSRLPIGYTPSYVSVSVAVFGYSGYGRTSLSSGNLHCARVNKPMGFLMSNRPTVNSTGHKNAANATLIDQSTSVKQSTNDSQKGPLHIEITGSPSADLQANTVPQPEVVKSKPEAETLAGTGPSDSPRTPNKITPKVASISPCPSPAGEATDSARSSVRLRRTRTRSQTGNSDDQEHWHRSSLIMFAVAHASPRGRLATSITSPDSSFAFSHLDHDDNATESLPASQRGINGTHEKRDHFIQGDGGYTSLTHSYHESILEEPNEETESPVRTTLPATSPTPTRKKTESDRVDGHYFLRLTDQVQAEIAVQIDRTESDLESVEMDEEVAGVLRTAVGKAKLLLSEKFVQFRNLCQQNLDWMAAQEAGNSEQMSKTDGPDLVTLVSDLDGFWAMVMLQVDDVRALFESVERLRSNGWKPLTVEGTTENWKNVNGAKSEPAGDKVDGTKTPAPTPTARKRNTGSKSNRSRNDSVAQAKARERLAMAKREMRAKQMKAKADGAVNNEDGFIIV